MQSTMNVDVEKIASQVKEFAKKHAYTFTDEDKTYAPLEVWQYAARLHGWSVRIKEVKKEKTEHQATAEAVDKYGSIAGSGIGCVTQGEVIKNDSTYERMKLAQSRAVSCMLTNTLSDVMKIAGYATTPLEEYKAIEEKPVVEDATPAPVPVDVIEKKRLDHFTDIVDEYTDKLSLMVEKLDILADARKAGLSADDVAVLEQKIEQKYGEL